MFGYCPVCGGRIHAYGVIFSNDYRTIVSYWYIHGITFACSSLEYQPIGTTRVERGRVVEFHDRKWVFLVPMVDWDDVVTGGESDNEAAIAARPLAIAPAAPAPAAHRQDLPMKEKEILLATRLSF